MQIIDTGGTINKVYNECNGHLEVKEDFLENIKSTTNFFTDTAHIIKKDSLDITDSDRLLIINTAKLSEKRK